MPVVKVKETKDIIVLLKCKQTNEVLGEITVDIKEFWWQPEECDGFTKEECKILDYSKDVYCWAQKAVSVPQKEK